MSRVRKLQACRTRKGLSNQSMNTSVDEANAVMSDPPVVATMTERHGPFKRLPPAEPVTRIRPGRSWEKIDYAELWAHREVLYFLMWRDFKVRYKQTIIGAAWVILQPVLITVVFTIFLGKLIRVPSDGIIGPNGSGKSTRLKILARITKPTTGQADLYGRAGSLLGVGTGFHPDLTGRENIYLNGAMLGMRRNEITRKFDEIVAFAQIEDFLDTPAKRYSSGMYLRVAFAIAAHLEPDILLLDEVLTIADAAFQRKCLRKVKDASQEGTTVLFVSHNLTSVRQLCDRAFHIHSGELHDEGKPETVIANYLKDVAVEENGLS
jgi:ABC-type polysaccharide/polyol phosphate transport system ATPase subunit